MGDVEVVRELKTELMNISFNLSQCDCVTALNIF